MTGECLICKLKNLSPIEGADRIVQANLFGETVIVSKDYQEGQLGLLFDIETQLSENYVKNNNMYRHNTLNADPNITGYLEDNRRVRPIKLKGVKCTALFMPIESLSFIGSKKLPQEGTQITEWDGQQICSKYVRPTRGGNRQNKVAKKVQEVFHFAEHCDTDQLMRNLHRIKVGDKLIVTSKVHGTSCRVGSLPVLPRNRFKRWWYQFWDKKLPYKMVVGSRHALKHVEGQAIDNKGSYYADDIWSESAYKYFHGKLNKGETVYYEIVGYLPSGATIMPQHSNEKLKNFLDKQEYKDLIDKYGSKTTFHYGCAGPQQAISENTGKGFSILKEAAKKAEYKIFVYRITLTTEHGQAIDLSWEQVKRRCEELGVNHVPEFFSDYVIDQAAQDYFQSEDYWSRMTEQDDPNFPTHLNEGIVVRIEDGSLRPTVLKSKRYAFKVLEGIIKDSAEYADLEESN